MNLDAKTREIVVGDAKARPKKPFASNRVVTTKYSMLTFVPVFLLNQFSRPNNMFFLFILFVPYVDVNISPLKEWSTALPLSLVLVFSALKDIYEDLKRYYSDREVNNATVTVLRNGKFESITSEGLKVGEIVKVLKGESFPADLVILSSSEPEGMAYLETSNIDGESNLKIRIANPNTTHLVDEAELSKLIGNVICEEPNERIYSFEGIFEFDDISISLDQNNLLLRGAVLKNTDWIIGISIYTGHQSKIMKNMQDSPIKTSSMDIQTNKQYIYIVFAVILMSFFGAVCHYLANFGKGKSPWYLTGGLDQAAWSLWESCKSFLSFIILYNTLVPISLTVTLEFVRLLLAVLINNDLEMYDSHTDTPAVANSSSIIEELGQVHCILTDKTGTLTRNEMILKHVLISGKTFLNCAKIDSELRTRPKTDDVNLFLQMLSICHTVMIDTSDSSKPCYKGSSPDELAMVEVSKVLGYEFLRRSAGNLTLLIDGEEETFAILAVIEFTSQRKRMSVMIQLPDGSYYLFCKGADTVISKILKNKNAQVVVESMAGLEKFAAEGMRTLCFSYRRLEDEEALEWLDLWHDALSTVNDRQDVIDKAAALIERDLEFLGATGVEDRLQDGVPEAIETLSAANIKIWMLTGDRHETAISTAHLSHLIDESTQQFHILEGEQDEVEGSLNSFAGVIRKAPADSNFALVLTGSIVEIVLSEDFANSLGMEHFRFCAQRCRTLLFCRLSPFQKSQIAQFVREHLNQVTLAIGDGGNDVGMIQEANVGVGIAGKEGLQASRNADFSIAQFRFLVKLILVHGSWSLHRLSRVVIYSIYKNIVFFCAQFWFSFFNMYSAQILFENWMIVNWNLVFTSWPPTIVGITDQFVHASDLVENPQLYRFSQNNLFYDDKAFWSSALNGVFHSFLIFFGTYLCFPEGFLLASGQTSTIYIFGSIIFTTILHVVCMKIALFTNYMTFFLLGFVLVSASLWYVATLVFYEYWPEVCLTGGALESFKIPSFWAIVLLVSVLVTLRDFLWKFYLRQFRPHAYHIIQEVQFEKASRKQGTEVRRSMQFFKGSDRKPRTNRGFSFSQTYGQSKVLRAYGQSPQLASKLSTSSLEEDGL